MRQHAAGQSAAHLGESTELLCRKLRQSGMAPRVLCELVEVADPEWTGAAEALLGRDREAVFVDRADIVAATAIFKEGRREFRGASLVSLNKLEQFHTPPQAGTFPSIFRSDDPDALAFIMRRYGNVRLADSLSDFNAPGRAIMRNAKRLDRTPDPLGDADRVNHFGPWKQEKKFFAAVAHGQLVVIAQFGCHTCCNSFQAGVSSRMTIPIIEGRRHVKLRGTQQCRYGRYLGGDDRDGFPFRHRRQTMKVG